MSDDVDFKGKCRALTQCNNNINREFHFILCVKGKRRCCWRETQQREFHLLWDFWISKQKHADNLSVVEDGVTSSSYAQDVFEYNFVHSVNFCRKIFYWNQELSVNSFSSLRFHQPSAPDHHYLRNSPPLMREALKFIVIHLRELQGNHHRCKINYPPPSHFNLL